MFLYLVRHGETTGNVGGMYQTEETPLTPMGEKQAARVALRLKDLSIDLIYSSTHLRAQQTSKIISQEIGAKIEPWEKLMELRRPKEVRGKHLGEGDTDQILDDVSKNFGNPDWKYSDEENFFDLKERASLVLDHLSKKHAEQTVVCVSHGTFIKFLVCQAIFGDELTPKIFETFRHKVWAENTGVTKLEFTEKHGWRLSFWNDVTHI